MDALIQKFMELLSTVPIIPLIIMFSILRRFIGKKPAAQQAAERPRETVPEDGYGGDWAPTFDSSTSRQEFRDPSVEPSSSSSMFGGKYGTTKFGFDDSEWGSTFENDKDRDDRPHVRRS